MKLSKGWVAKPSLFVDRGGREFYYVHSILQHTVSFDTEAKAWVIYLRRSGGRIRKVSNTPLPFQTENDAMMFANLIKGYDPTA